jgi:hypothetical protein
MVTRSFLVSCLYLLAQAAADSANGQSSTNPLDVFRSCVTIGTADLARLDAGLALIRTLPQKDGNLAIFAARRVSADCRRCGIAGRTGAAPS